MRTRLSGSIHDSSEVSDTSNINDKSHRLNISQRSCSETTHVESSLSDSVEKDETLDPHKTLKNIFLM